MLDQETNRQNLAERKQKIDAFVEKIRILECESAENPDDIETSENLEGCRRLYETLIYHYKNHLNYVTENNLFEADVVETMLKMAKYSR
ncbi:hypothetical protein [Pedobacter sp. V48]|uniref:hypothetical protein n=1 Tax=Pedobacter sp. V48 TaxID=509635 RepID=UPI0003E468B3|nr:hypothetical protein [Pedobacter sp. V48]ETZ20197.1 hypothetical protein N824_08265 [Pedobacter sp. V48]